jgi:hypothetical protein
MPTFRRPQDLRRHLESALAFQQKQIVIKAQAELGSADVSPIRTGRLRSSWFASRNSASDAVPPEGANAPRTDAQGLAIEFGDEIHLTSSLDYTESVAVEGNVQSKPKTWFFDFRTQGLAAIAEASGKEAKRQFDL